MKKAFNLTEALLEETLLKEEDLPLILSQLSMFLVMSRSITILVGKWSIWGIVELKAEGENCIFPKTLLDATMQDGGIRERRNCTDCHCILYNKLLIIK